MVDKIDEEFEQLCSFDNEMKVFDQITSPATVNVLEFWANKSKTLPILSRLARLIYSPQATSCASESVFSKGGLIIRCRRTNLSLSKVNMLMFLNYAFK